MKFRSTSLPLFKTWSHLILCFSFFLFSICLSFAQHPKIDSLTLVVKTAKEDTNKVNMLNDLTKLLTNIGELDKAKIHGDNSLTLAEKLKFKHGTAYAYNNLGVIYEIKGSYIEARKYHENALKIRQELGDKKGIAGSLNNIGNLCFLQGNLQDALKNYTEALELKKKYSPKKSLINAYNNLGLVYFDLKNYDKALEYFNSALKVSQELENPNGISNALVNIGLIYERKGNNPEALKMYLDVLKIQETIGEKAATAAANVNITSVFIKMDRSPEARKYCETALQLSKEMGNIQYMKECYINLSLIDSVQGNKKGQLANYEMYVSYSDSLNNLDNERILTENQIKFNLAKKSAADSVKNELKKNIENEKYSQEIKKQKVYTYGGLLAFIIMLIITGISFRAFRQKRKANNLISEQKLIVEEQQKAILDSIHYAKRIQNSLLPTEKYIQKNLNRLTEKHLAILLLFLSQSLFLFSQNNLDSLEKVANATTNDSVKFDIFVKLGKNFSMNNKVKAEEFANKALALAKKQKSKENEATAYRVFGTTYFYSEDCYTAIDYYTKSLEIMKTLDNAKALPSQYRNIGLCYNKLGNTSKATDYYFQALKIAETNLDSALLTNLYNDLGTLFFHQNNLETAKEYFSKSYTIAKAKNNLNIMAIIMNNIGSIYSQKEDFAPALTCYKESMEIRKKIGDSLGLVSSYTNIAQIYTLRKEFNKALDYNTEALKIANGMKYDVSIAYVDLCLASTYKAMKNYPKAIEYGNASLKLNEKTEDPRRHLEVHKQIYEIYKAAEQPEKALLHFRKYLSYHNGMNKQDISKKIVQIQFQYDYEKKQTADSLENVQIAKMEEITHQQEISEQKTYMYGGVIGVLLMIIFSTVSLRAYRQKRKDNLLITEQKLMVEEKQKEILDSIHYAKRIQLSLLPTEKYILQQLKRLHKGN